jgi:hypothetical protein
MTGTELIALERRRQVEQEGYNDRHDDNERGGQLALAAACYAIPDFHRGPMDGMNCILPKLWPYAVVWWKPVPRDRVRELVKAGALIAAEIDRLSRLDKAKAAEEDDDHGLPDPC